MSVRKILVLPNPILKQKCAPISSITAEIKQLADDMLETMYEHRGIGLAASQIGELKRLIVVDVASEEEPRNPFVMINPEISWESEETESASEGCLSIPDFQEEITRPGRISVRYLDLNGGTKEITAENMLSRCIQHEVDHLNGRLIIDHLSKLKRELVTKKFKKMAKLAVT